MDIMNGHPVELPKATVDRPSERLKLVANIGVRLDALPRGRGDLGEDHLTLILWVALEEAAERLELLGQTLGVIQPIDADDAAHRAAGLHETSLPTGPGKVTNVDADGETRHRNEPLEGSNAAIGHNAA